jgi:hypothetical protein
MKTEMSFIKKECNEETKQELSLGFITFQAMMRYGEVVSISGRFIPLREEQRIAYPLIKRGKGKAVPLQAWSGPKGSRKLRFPDYITTAQDGGKVVSLKHRPPLPPGNAPGTHFC